MDKTSGSRGSAKLFACAGVGCAIGLIVSMNCTELDRIQSSTTTSASTGVRDGLYHTTCADCGFSVNAAPCAEMFPGQTSYCVGTRDGSGNTTWSGCSSLATGEGHVVLDGPCDGGEPPPNNNDNTNNNNDNNNNDNQNNNNNNDSEPVQNTYYTTCDSCGWENNHEDCEEAFPGQPSYCVATRDAYGSITWSGCALYVNITVGQEPMDTCTPSNANHPDHGIQRKGQFAQ